MRKIVSIAVLAMLVASCAPAQMRLPAGLSEGGSRFVFDGVNGPTSGEYVAGPYHGRFDNALSRSRLLLGDRKRQAWTRFTIEGGAVDVPISAQCEVFSRAIDLGSTKITVAPLSYGCAFERDGRALPATFELHEVVAGGTAIYREERSGEIELDGAMLRFRSVHAIKGSGMPTITPVGYAFERGGRAIAALDLAGDPVLTVDPGVAPEMERAIAVASVALAIFREPDED